MAKVVRDLIEYNGISSCLFTKASMFKQINTDYIFCIPVQKPDIDKILKVWVDGCVTSTQLVKTPVGTSYEGQNITGYKALICGDISLKIEYVACNATQSVHTAHTTFPFSSYVVLPGNINPYASINTSIAIEDIFSEQMDCRCIYNNITMFVTADIC